MSPLKPMLIASSLTALVRLHDAAAAGRELPAVPDRAGEPADAPSGVALSAVAATVAANYGLCNGFREQLNGWRAWYDGQRGGAMRRASSMTMRAQRRAATGAEPAEADISHRVLLDSVVGELKAMEQGFSLRFTHLDEGHARLERRLDAVDAKLDETRETVADLVGERRGERRVQGRSMVRRVSVLGAITIGAVTVLGGLSSAWQMTERLLAALAQAVGQP